MDTIESNYFYDPQKKIIGVILDPKIFKAIINEIEDYEEYLRVTKKSKKKEKVYTQEQIREDIKRRLKK